MKTIPLTRRLFTKVDDEDYNKFAVFRWYAQEDVRSKKFRAARHLKGKVVYLHREILKAPPEMEIDHISGDTLDNQKKNLRMCIHAENNRNKGLKSTNKSGYKGVYWNKRSGKWSAQIRVNYKAIYLGLFNNREDAARAYDKIALEKFGKFASLNFK